MKRFNRPKKGPYPANWDSAYPAAPRFYAKPDGSPFGAFALTEGVETVLPTHPQTAYAVDGKPVSEWKLLLVSTTKDSIIGDLDYFTALEQLDAYTLDSKADAILVKSLSFTELEGIKRA